MQRHLLYGTSLVAAAMLAAGGAVAQDKKMMKLSISINGGFDALIGTVLDEEWSRGGSDQTPDTTGGDVKTDAEIHFNGRATTDNGMKIHARVELEGQNDTTFTNDGSKADPIDEYFLSVSGSFGQIILGGTGGAPVKMLTGLSGSWATGVGETLSFDVNSWVPSAAGGPTHYYLQHSRLDTGDNEKVTYISPKLAGFQIGASYGPLGHNSDGDSNGRNKLDSHHDGFEVAASYGGKFGDVGFGIGAGMTSYQGADGKAEDDRSDWLVAGRLDFGGGFRVAAAHKQVTNESKAQQSQLTDVGVRYIAGANSFSLTGVMGEMDNDDRSYTAVMGSYARAMGPGVKWHLNLIHTESQADNGDENTGLILVSGLRVKF
ncbi:MAG: porin [Rhodospirillales bacterium]|nr:porin [Rhodospirillales bacterium]